MNAPPNRGTSCETTCALVNKPCNIAAMNAVNSIEAVDAVAAITPPGLTCNSYGPPTGHNNSGAGDGRGPTYRVDQSKCAWTVGFTDCTSTGIGQEQRLCNCSPLPLPHPPPPRPP
ncbi:hypothetical protein T492DRAFT_917915, partial [Pavlovales sp. CCMP2436]